MKKKSRVVILTRNPNNVKPLKVLGPPGQIEIISGNIFEEGLLETLMRGKFAVINLCGILYESRTNEFDIIHHFLPDLISKICKKLKTIKFIHISALGASKSSSSKYSKTKALGEDKVIKNFKTTKILRPSIIYGIGDNFFGLFEKFQEFSHNSYNRTICEISTNFNNDVALAVVKLLESSK